MFSWGILHLMCDAMWTSNYTDVMTGAIASQITSLTIVYSTVYSDAYQRKHHTSALLAFVRGIHRGPVNSPHKWPVTLKMLPFDDVIMNQHSNLAGSPTIHQPNIKLSHTGMKFTYCDFDLLGFCPTYAYRYQYHYTHRAQTNCLKFNHSVPVP